VPASHHKHDDTPVILQQILVALIWGGTWIGGRVVAAEVPVLQASALRFLLGTATLAILVWRLEPRLPRPTAKEAWLIAVMGATGIVLYNLFFFYGLRHVQAGRGALVVALNPVAVALAAWLLMGETLSRIRVLGVVIALGGCLTIIGRGDPLALLRGDVGRGELAILGCVAAWSVYTLVGRVVSRTVSPLAMTFYASIVGGAALLVAATAAGDFAALPRMSTKAALSILYLGVLSNGFSYAWYATGVKRLGAMRAAAFINLVPVGAVVLGALLLGERIGLPVMLGGALVLLGVWLTNRPTRRPRS
jgi:drug/metabolite transporter (DMT)-like permease